MASSNIRWPICRIRFWCGARCGSARAARRPARLLVAALAIYSLLQKRGPFVTGSEADSLRLIGSYIGIVAVSNLLLAAAAAERRRALAERGGK